MPRLSLGVLAHLVPVFLGLTLAPQASAQAGDNEVCASCHEEIIKKVATMAHAKVACAQCHEKHDDYPHPAKIPKPACSKCHGDETAAFRRSVHSEAARAGNAGAP